MPETAGTQNVPFRAMEQHRADLELFAACFARNGVEKPLARLDWQYLKNPTGTLFVDFAVASSDRLAAIYATQPAHMRIAGAPALGLQSVDTITDGEFRGRGLFLKLASRNYDRAAAAGARLVYGFPNGSSAHGFYERLSWHNLDPIPFLIRPLRTSFVAQQLKQLGQLRERLPDLRLFRSRQRQPRRGQIEAIERYDERATALWHVFARNVRLAVERDARYLNWRIVERPHENYRSNGIVADGQLRALVVHVLKAKHGGQTGYIMESICEPGWEAELRVLLGNAVSDIGAAGGDVVLAWCFDHSSTYHSYLRQGFLPFPSRLRPIELHFGARGFDEPTDRLAADRRNWYLSYLDADTT